MLLLSALDILVVIILLLLPPSAPATAPCVLALTTLPNLVTSVTSILQRLTTLPETQPHYSQSTSFTAFLKLAPRIQPHTLQYIPPNNPLSQHLLFRFPHPLTSAQFWLFLALSHQTPQWPPCISLNPSKFDAFASMTALVLIPTGGASMETVQFHGHFITYLHLLTSDHFKIYFTIQTHLSYKSFNI